jgi:hypothetical protein
MLISEKKAAKSLMSIPLLHNKLKFFDMSKTNKKSPVLQRNGVKNSYCSYSDTYKIKLTAMGAGGEVH